MVSAHHGNALPPEMNRYLQRRMQEWLDEEPGRQKAQLARLLGLSPERVTNITKNGRGAGNQTETAMAKFLGVSIEEMRRRAREEFKRELADEPGALELQREDRYPNRTKAVEFMRDQVHPEAIARTLSEQLDSDEDPEPKWWADLIESFDKRVRMELKRPQMLRDDADRARVEGDDMEQRTAPKPRRKA